MRTEQPTTIFLKDYTPPPYKVSHTDLRFEIFAGKTTVRAKTRFVKNRAGDAPLFLNGEHLQLVSVALDGKDIQPKIFDSHHFTQNTVFFISIKSNE